MTNSPPFLGIKILDVSRILASPFASAQFAFLGAEVIKVEDPEKGDLNRYRPSNIAKLSEDGMSTSFLSQNAGKRSLTLNLREPEGQRIFCALAKDADIIIENLRTGTMERYGLGYERLRQLNPRLIYCSLTAYGSTGPKKRDPAFDPVVQAASGMMSLNGTPETAPVKVGPPILDFSTGLSASFAIATALFQRQREGIGQKIEVSLIDTAFVLMGSVVTDVLTAGAVPKAVGNTYKSNPTNASFETRKGSMYIAAMEDHQIANLWKALERPDIPQTEAFSTHALRAKNSLAVRAEIQRTLLTRDATEWETILNALGVPGMRIRSLPEALADPELNVEKICKVFQDVKGVKGPVSVPLVPFKVSASVADTDLPPPTLGAHTNEILKGLGHTDAEINELKKQRII